ncbi:MAG: nucleoside hydrolase [Mycoplasmoidaceae bacterium]|nr:nucleoside hydrolase [Mycoplasmoidaceae bacterium]
MDEKWDARSKKDPTRVKNAVDVLRHTLANNRGSKIKLITIGMLNNIAHLLQSEGDAISPKSGKQLFEENVSEVVLMGGRFNDPTYSEFNIKEALWAAKEVINNETVVPKTFCG